MLTEEIKSSFKDTSKKLTGFKQRTFMAQVSLVAFSFTIREDKAEMGLTRCGSKFRTQSLGRKQWADYFLRLNNVI